MRNKLWKSKLNQWKVLKFALAFCVWTDEFRWSHGSRNDAPPAFLANRVSSQEKIPKLQENSEIFVEENFSRPWVPKCCRLNYGFTFEEKSQCVETGEEFLPDFEDRPDYSQVAKNLPATARYEYYIGDPCLDGKYILDSSTYTDDQYSIYANGTLLYSSRLHDKEEFCLENLNGTIRVFFCFGDEKIYHELNFTHILYAVCLIISIPFLLVTALTYLCLERFRDLRGKSLSCHVLCLATGYLFLAVVQLSSDQLDEGLCIAAGFIIQFFFVAAFFWLNIICYDTWRSMNDEFQGISRLKSSRSEKVMFCRYSVYGWYGPFILSIVTVIMDLEPAIPESFLKPNFGLKSCWFYSDDAALPYFYGPIAIIIFINIIFFIICARKICLHGKRVEKCGGLNRDSVGEIREVSLLVRLYTNILKECIYLFCIMGINWLAEVLSWATGGSQAIWAVTDLFNALQGVMIFFLFVIKPTAVRSEVKRRICIVWEKIMRRNSRHKGIARSRTAKPPYETPACYSSDESESLSQSSTAATATVVTTKL